MNKLSVLVTGGAGFIGSNITQFLLENKVKKVRVIDNLSTGNKNNLEPFLEKYDNLEFIYGDISKLEICRKAVKNVDIICHQAALGSVPRSINDPLSSHISNVNGFLNILIAAKEEGIKRVVYASSSSVYGNEAELPKVEEKVGSVLSPYAATKKIDEIYANVFTKCYDMECIGLRYFNVFGPRQDPHGAYAAVIPKFIDIMKNDKQPTINGDGTYSRDFTYVDNVVQGNVLALTTNNKKCFGEVFNIGTGGRVSILELVSNINKYLQKDISPILGTNRPGDIPHSNADISKAKKMLGYDPKISFKEGILKTINYHNVARTRNQKINIKDIDFNKLLNRTSIIVDNSQFSEKYQNKTILITGGCGSIGSEIVTQLLKMGLNNLIIYDNSELGMFDIINNIKRNYPQLFGKIKFVLGDIKDNKKLENIFINNKISIVYHVAAYKHVPMLEKNILEGIKVNIIGSKNIADTALKFNIEKFIFVSTDKAVNPTNIMGCTKRISELYINNLNKRKKTKFITTRFGNVLGSNGSVIPTFIKRINCSLDLNITHKDINRYFMTIPEASQLVIKASFIGNYSDILLFDMGKPVKIIDLAKKFISIYCNFKPKINIIGLRPGEKLYEELLCKSELCIPTSDKNIMKYKHAENDFDNDSIEIYNQIINLKEINDNIYIKKLFKKIVPEYNYS